MAYSSNNGGKPQNIPQRKRYQQKTQKYSEKYGSNRPNPYTGYLPPGTHPGGIYRPDAIDSRRTEAQPNTAPSPAVTPPQQPIQPAAPVQEAPAARVHRREYSPNRKKNRPSITTETPSVSENEALLRRMDEIRREAASEAAAVEPPKPAPAPQTAQPEIRLSPEGKPLIAIPFVGENGETEMRWIPVVMPEESKEAAAAVAPVIIADTDDDDDSQSDAVIVPVIAADIDLPDTENEESVDEEEPSDGEIAAAVILPETEDESDTENDQETDAETESDQPEDDAVVPLIIPVSTDIFESEDAIETDFDDDFDDEFDDELVGQEDTEEVSDDVTDGEEQSLESESDDSDDTSPEDEDEFETEPEDEAENDMFIYTDEDLINSEDSQSDEELLEDEDVFVDSDPADEDTQDDIEESEDDSDTDDEDSDETEPEEEDEDTSDDEEEQVLIYTDEDLDGDDESEYEDDEEYEDDDFEESEEEEDEDEVEEESDDDEESDEDEEDESDDEDEDVEEDEDEEDDDMIIAPSFVKRTLTTSSYTMHRTQTDSDDDDDDMRVYSPSSDNDRDDVLSQQDDALFIRRNHPEGSTAVFEIPKGIKLPSYIDDDEFLEQWLSEGDDMGNISKKTKRKISTIAGAMTLALALVGLGFILLTLFSSLQTCSSKSSKNDEYVDFIMPVVYTDISAFESWEAIGKDKLLECSLVAAIDSADTPYPTDDNNRSLVPSADVLAQTKRLFGESATLDFESMGTASSTESSGYFYDDLNDVFHVEQTGFGDVAADIIGSPKVKSGTIEFIVGYKSASAIADDDAEQSYYKTMEYILNRTEDGYYVAKLREYKTED